MRPSDLTSINYPDLQRENMFYQQKSLRDKFTKLFQCWEINKNLLWPGQEPKVIMIMSDLIINIINTQSLSWLSSPTLRNLLYCCRQDINKTKCSQTYKSLIVPGGGGWCHPGVLPLPAPVLTTCCTWLGGLPWLWVTWLTEMTQHTQL